MNALGAVILIALVIVTMRAGRRLATMAMMAGVLCLTQSQQIEVGGINFFAIRFLELAAFARVIVRKEFSFRQLNGIDQVLLFLYCFTTLVYCFRNGDDKAYVIGQGVDAFLCYFTFRGLIGGIDDFQWFLRAFIVLLAPYALLVLIESRTGHNPFTLVGGIEDGAEWVRNGRPRCFGSFRQPDTLGMFAASFLPLYIGLACIARERKVGIFGALLCLVIAWAADSGGAASAAAMGVLGWLFWNFRTQMRKVRWGIVGMITAFVLVMNAPVWYILARVSSVTGGTGWHRSYLIDVADRHLDQWWLGGMPLIETRDWFPYQLASGTADITNQFLAFGLTAGLGAIILFILLLKRAYSGLGNALAAVRVDSEKPAEAEFLLWGLGVMLLVHITDWFGITYFDQMYVVWFMELAAVATLSGAFFVPLEEAALEAQSRLPLDSAATGSGT